MNEPIDSRQLQIFLRLAQEGSLKKAAEKLFLTTSAISHAISKLELDLGVPLFNRSGRQLLLNNRGKLLYRQAGSVMARLCALRHDVAQENLHDSALLRVGAGRNFISYLLPEIVREFRQCFPRAKLRLQAGDRDSCLRLMRLNELDAAIVVDPPGDTVEWVETPLFVDRQVLVCGANHPLAQFETIPWRQLADRTLLVSSGQSYAGRKLLGATQKRGLSFRDVMEVGSTAAVIEMVKLGHGVALLPDWVVRSQASPTLTCRSIEGFDVRRTWCYVTQRTEADSLTNRTLRRLCVRQVELACGDDQVGEDSNVVPLPVSA